MRLINISESHFIELQKKGISLDLVCLLEQCAEGKDIYSLRDSRVQALVRTLERKGLIELTRVSREGKELLRSLISAPGEQDSEVVVKRIEGKEKEWELFLAAYPPNNKFTWKGKYFEGDRGIKKNTKDGKALFTKILNEGVYTTEDIAKAVIAEAISKMESSVKQGQNKMNYFVNTESYLRQKAYVNFMEEGRDLTNEEIETYKQAFNRKKKPSKPSTGTVDI